MFSLVSPLLLSRPVLQHKWQKCILNVYILNIKSRTLPPSLCAFHARLLLFAKVLPNSYKLLYIGIKRMVSTADMSSAEVSADTIAKRKRNSKYLGWLLAGCCFSKRSREDGTGENVSDFSTMVDVRSENPVTESSDTCSLLPAITVPSELDTQTEQNLAVSECAETENKSVHEQKASYVDKDAVLLKDQAGSSKHDEESTPMVEEHSLEGEKPEIEVKVSTGSVKGAKGGKPRPNYFVAIQVDNPQIHNSLQCVQDAILECKPLMRKVLINLSTLHITLVVMHIAQEQELERAKDALATSYHNLKQDLENEPLYLTFEGLSSFRKQVLFAELKADASQKRLFNLYKSVVSSFKSHGFDVGEKDTFTPHLTVAKLSKNPKLKKKGLKVISPAWYEGFEDNLFGTQLVKSLQLLRMAQDDSGYYECHRECFFDVQTSNTKQPLEEMLSKSLEEKKEMRQKIRDITTQKLGRK